MQVSFAHPAPEGERFAPGCFDSALGAEVAFGNHAGLPATRGTLVSAVIDPGGASAEITADIPGDSPLAAEISRQGGGGPGPFHVCADGRIDRIVEIRRRDPAEAARLMRAWPAVPGWPADDIDAFAAEVTGE